MSVYTCRKVLNPGKGYPCVFRNWRAQSHCQYWHGYDLIFEVTFQSNEAHLSEEQWVMDFGAFGTLKDRLNLFFDHTWIIAEDDPLLQLTKIYIETAKYNGCPCGRLVTLPKVGVEHFAMWLAIEATDMIQELGRLGLAHVREARVYENAANSGGFIL